MKHAELRQHILQTASNLFYTQGFNGTGINEIISASAIAKATLYSHFSSKDELCLAYLQTKNESFLLDISNFCEVRPNGAPQIMAIFDYLLTLYTKPNFNGCWNVNTLAELAPENEIIRKEIKKQKTYFINFLKTVLLSNFPILDKPSASKLARKIYLLFESAWVESNVHKAKWPIMDSKEMCATFFEYEQ